MIRACSTRPSEKQSAIEADGTDGQSLGSFASSVALSWVLEARATTITCASSDNGADLTSCNTGPASYSPEPNVQPFTRVEAERIMSDSLMRVTSERRQKDYRLLELIIPSLEGAFEVSVNLLMLAGRSAIDVLASDSNDARAIRRVELLGLNNAHKYLLGSPLQSELSKILIHEQKTDRVWWLKMLSAPLEAPLIAFPRVVPAHVQQLRTLYRMGRDALQSDYIVYAGVRKLLELEV